MAQTITLNRVACPIRKDSTAEALQICFAFPRRAGKASPTRFVQNRDPPTPAPDELMCNYDIYLETLHI